MRLPVFLGIVLLVTDVGYCQSPCVHPAYCNRISVPGPIGPQETLQIHLPSAAELRAMHHVYSNEVDPGQPWGPGGAQHTVVNVPIVPTKDYLVWSLCTFVYANIFCLGLGALINSVRARDQKALGDQDGARRHASSARIFNIVAVTLTSVTLFICIVVVLVASARR